MRLEQGPLMVLAGDVAGLAVRQTESGGVERHLGNECRATTGGGQDRDPQGRAVTPADGDPLHHLGSGPSTSCEWQR